MSSPLGYFNMTIDDGISASIILPILYVIEAVSYTVCVIVLVRDIHSGINQLSLIIIFGSIIALWLITTTDCNNWNWVYSVS